MVLRHFTLKFITLWRSFWVIFYQVLKSSPVLSIMSNFLLEVYEFWWPWPFAFKLYHQLHVSQEIFWTTLNFVRLYVFWDWEARTGQTDEQTNGPMYRPTDGRTDGRIDFHGRRHKKRNELIKIETSDISACLFLSHCRAIYDGHWSVLRAVVS